MRVTDHLTVVAGTTATPPPASSITGLSLAYLTSIMDQEYPPSSTRPIGIIKAHTPLVILVAHIRIINHGPSLLAYILLNLGPLRNSPSEVLQMAFLDLIQIMVYVQILHRVTLLPTLIKLCILFP